MLLKRFPIFLVCIILQLNGVLGQNITRSPYSIIGLGELVYTGNATNLGLGQTSQGIRRTFEVNTLNPASYSSFLQTNIEAGGVFNYGSIQNSDQKNHVSTAYLGYISFGIPLDIKRGIGMSFGLSPYSSTGYNITSPVNIPNDTFTIPATYYFNGKGGLSKFHWGFGFKVYKDLSLGMNLNYLFGQTRNTTQLYIPVDYNMMNVNEDKNTYLHGASFDLGAQYHHVFNDNKEDKDEYELVLGGTVKPAYNLNGEQAYILRSLPSGSLTGTKDTALIVDNQPGVLAMPLAWRAGFSFAKSNHWMIAMDARATDWSKFTNFGRNDSLQNSKGISFGASYCNDPLNLRNVFKRMEYRAGFRYDQTNLRVNGIGLDEWAISAGIGLPLAKSRSKLNIGFEYVNRGTTKNDLIRENYFRVVFGISFTDRWFRQYRYD